MTEFKFKKKYGQNFLQNESIIDKIVNSINPKSDDLIIEIGPGSGALTKKLKKYNANLLAFEIDEETKKYLLPLEDDKTKIIFEDFMESDIKKHILKMKYNKLYIIGNLPYYITTPILERVIDLQLNEESLTIMVQKEVGDRFLAKPHTREYGYMTVLLNYSYDITKVVDAPRKEFYPVPNVDSVVVKLSKKETPNADYTKFKQIIKESFQFKRKTIYNNLKKYDKETLERVLNDHNATLQSRAEDLDLETFIDLSNRL